MKKLYFAAIALVGFFTMASLNTVTAVTVYGDVDPELPNEDGCDNYVYYLADNQGQGANSNIYRVDVSGATAELTWLQSYDYGCHIAYNPMDDLLYVVRSSNGSFRTLDVSVVDGESSAETALSTPMNQSVAVAFDDNGVLYIGSGSAHKIVSVDVTTGDATLFANANVNGGDLAFGHDGIPYLATRTGGGRLYSIAPGDNQQVGTVPQVVTGLATTVDGQFLVSSLGSTSLIGKSSTGASNGVSIALTLDGNPFTLANGDLAYGCADSENNETCDNFSTYYVNHGPGVSGTDLYRVEFDGNNANLTHLENFNYQIHMGMNASEGVLYLVNANGNFIEFYDLSTGPAGQLPIIGDINSLYAVVYNPADGLLYVGDSNDNEIYTIDLLTGVATFYADAPIQGGDIVFQDGVLYCAQRDQNKLHTVLPDLDGVPDGTLESTHIGSVPDETNGMAAANNSTSLICALYGTTTFQEISNVDGTVLNTYQILLDGSPLSIRHGDMASGCADQDNIETSSCDYKLYYVHKASTSAAGELYEVTLNNDNTASTTLIEDGLNDAHIAISPDGTIIYVVENGGFRTYEVATGTFGNNVNIHKSNGQNLNSFPAAVCDDEGNLYVAGGQNSIYSVAPDGEATAIATGVGVDGGDLIFADGDLWLIRRTAHEFRNITTPANSFTVPVYDINGAAVLGNGNVLVSDGNGESLFKEINLNSQNVVKIYDTGLPLFNGDLAGVCTGNNPDIPSTGDCYASELFDYSIGASFGGGSVAANRQDATQALGEPERIDQLVFVSLGYGGFATYGFNGAVLNELGDDLEIVETTYGNDDCSSYFEFADIYVSQDGTNFHFAKTVCRSDRFVDISDAGTFEFITHVKVVNNNDLSNTPDGFDLDGIVALHNCENGQGEGPEIGTEDEMEVTASGTERISTYPNPTTAESNVTFEVSSEGPALLELYNMQGRVVVTIANEVASPDQMYTYRIDASNLSNGVYIYKLTTPSGVSTKKLMVNH